ncbi:MAG: isocitrate lyase/phosphoenolpyruvate mutase family protein [Deltaproteobacteria bacterium]|jgi:2-methylisocitrate lyase-like PEP mutase family enzyme|nr:isocitrate lyase/phosphoenolpyruvate mutase family protein [Deltaproteobacteria bacterium]MBW2537150.1 isocitrate lyase/phosphoenolpyruvate mutase family protein [Deltaproteobacteria bacterium]
MAGSSRLRDLVDQLGVVLLPGCHDALSARVLARAGFSAGFISGYAVSASLLGRPDVGLVTAPELVEVARRICRAAGPVSILADADTGGGGPLNVQRTVADLVAAGAAGCILEDQVWPKKCGHMQGKRIVSAAEHVQTIRAAKAAAADADFLIIGRTDARAVASLDEAVDRARAYAAAGADGTFVEAPHDDDELRAIGERTPGLRVANMIEGGKTPLHTPAELGAMGFHLVLYPVAPIYAAARALIDVYRTLADHGSTRGRVDRLATFSEFNDLVGLSEVYALESDFRPRGE